MEERGAEGWHLPRRAMKTQKCNLNLIYQRELQGDSLRQGVFQEIQPIPYSLNSEPTLKGLSTEEETQCTWRLS